MTASVDGPDDELIHDDLAGKSHNTEDNDSRHGTARHERTAGNGVVGRTSNACDDEFGCRSNLSVRNKGLVLGSLWLRAEVAAKNFRSSFHLCGWSPTFSQP